MRDWFNGKTKPCQGLVESSILSFRSINFEDIMDIRTLGNKIAVTRIAASKETESGIILKRSDEPDRAKVEVIGPDVDEVQVGDILLVNWNEAVKVEGEYYVLPITGVIWVYGDE